VTNGRRGRPTTTDPDWGELIRSELDSYVPERLPARFAPRQTVRRARHAWRPLSAAVALFLLGFVVAILVGQGPVHVYRQATQVNGAAGAGSPSSLSSPTPSPDQTSKPTAAPTATNPGQAPAGAPRGAAAAGATPAPGVAVPQQAPPAQAPSPAPTPSPSNQGVCLLGVLCVGPKP
jgi:hypothetical protein